jgi:thymidylate synthase (FAD)
MIVVHFVEEQEEIMNNVRLIWATPQAEKHILYMARVSSEHQDSSDTRLLKYLINHKHWSPFEMCNFCVEIITSRAISAQILRHRSFSFQEFSQRYAENTSVISYEPRRQDSKNRQNSIDDIKEEDKEWWNEVCYRMARASKSIYNSAVEKGIAKECARMILPMATETKIYMNGNLRSWLHYLEIRCDESTQLEHRLIALQIKEIFKKEFPIIGDLL